MENFEDAITVGRIGHFEEAVSTTTRRAGPGELEVGALAARIGLGRGAVVSQVLEDLGKSTVRAGWLLLGNGTVVGGVNAAIPALEVAEMVSLFRIETMRGPRPVAVVIFNEVTGEGVVYEQPGAFLTSVPIEHTFIASVQQTDLARDISLSCCEIRFRLPAPFQGYVAHRHGAVYTFDIALGDAITMTGPKGVLHHHEGGILSTYHTSCPDAAMAAQASAFVTLCEAAEHEAQRLAHTMGPVVETVPDAGLAAAAAVPYEVMVAPPETAWGFAPCAEAFAQPPSVFSILEKYGLTEGPAIRYRQIPYAAVVQVSTEIAFCHGPEVAAVVSAGLSAAQGGFGTEADPATIPERMAVYRPPGNRGRRGRRSSDRR